MNTYPINLLLDKRKCLVVGGGKVASRKLEGLIKAGAKVNIVSLEASAKVKKLAQSGKVTLHERNFIESDLDGIFLIYLATDDRNLNLRISQKAAERQILCCIVDRNWEQGSFITPASVSKKEITVAVSSQGVDCRRSRLIKENFARHIDSIENSGLLVIGTDHNLMSMEERETIQLNGMKSEKTGSMIKSLWGIQEFAIINTCNRTEIIAAASPSESLIEILKILLKLDKFSEDKFYIKTGYEAFRHLCLTASGLLSQTPGENHISSQFKQCFKQSSKNKWSGTLLESLNNSVLHVSRQIRKQIKPVFKSFEIEELILQLSREKLDHISGKKVFILGTGNVGLSIKNSFAAENCDIAWVYFSQKPQNDNDNISIYKFSDLKHELVQANIIICAFSSNEPVITMETGTYISPGTLVFDIGMPRNVSSQLTETRKDVDFYSMEDIKHWFRKQYSTMENIWEIAERTIENHKDEYEKFTKSFVGRRKKQ
jgi:glutamyl-tRNA reductase